MESASRVQGLSTALERERIRREALASRVDELAKGRRELAGELKTLERRIDRLEFKLMVYSMVGGAAGGLLGTAGTAAALALGIGG